MSKYLVLRDCYGYKMRYWVKGEIVELQDSPDIPSHFQCLDKKVSDSVVAEDSNLDTTLVKPKAKNKKTRVV